MGFVARWLKLLLHVEDSPHRTALAFGIGVWIAFFPIWGIHTLMALGIAFAMRLSRAAMLLGAWVNSPWTAPPFYTAGTVLGCWILGQPVGSFAFETDLGGRALLHSLLVTLRPYLWPFVVGNTVVGVAGGLLAYALLRLLLERRARVD